MSTQNAVRTKFDDRAMAVRWQLEVSNDQNSRLSELLYELADEDLQKEVAPGRNTGSYILGHLAAVNDGMIPLLGFGEKRFPFLEEAFLKNPQNANVERPTVGEVRRVWADLLGVLRDNFEQLTADDWFQRHTAITEAEFAEEPHRNRIGVLISRTNHLSNHLGQLAFLKNKGEN